MTFDSELEFEKHLVDFLTTKGWDSHVIINPSEEELIQNWADILYKNNSSIDQLDAYPLTPTEMQQIITQVNDLHTPLALNGFINGKTVNIVRDNPQDKRHLGQTVSLAIYDRNQIASGTSVYQIVRQPKFHTAHPLASDRRGDVMLLINGMPVIHIELKKSGIDVSQAANQIRKYYKEGIFSQGIFSLVQVFVAMNPDETIYFANPGSYDAFSPDYQFHWANFNNEPINDWKAIATHLLSIPMAHQMIGFYTVADTVAGNLKVMRSYQYYAANAISDRVARCKWDDNDIYGGYIWHTTGSGKTMTSFKSAQLIADSGKADKVVFLLDRIELGTQTALEYRGFKNEHEEVQETEDTSDLVAKLRSDKIQDTLIVTSIQKMSRIDRNPSNKHDIDHINKKRVVIVIDEAHRDVFGDMLIKIRATFTRAIFFGFTGTPIHEENSKQMHTTNSIFGNELHRYSIADGIRDKNVLGFDPVKVLVFRDADLRKEVALYMAHATDEKEALANEKKKEVYLRYMTQVPMIGKTPEEDGIEDHIKKVQYESMQYRLAVVNDIREKFPVLSVGGKYHAVFATSSIPEAFDYYVLLRAYAPDLRTTCLVDPSIDNEGGGEIKEEVLLKILTNYNEQYGTSYDMPHYDRFKKDVAFRLAHKGPYKGIENKPDQCLDVLIVVNQMLTGFDSHWVNTLFLDKVLKNENLIQAFSRTNRLNGPDKPHGTIRYYRFPHTMERNIERAIKLYSGDKPFGVLADHLDVHLKAMNAAWAQIEHLFKSAGIEDFSHLMPDKEIQGQFAKLFRQFNKHLNAARLQGFAWDKPIQEIESEQGDVVESICMEMDETGYNALLQRYKEVFRKKGDGNDDVPFEVDPFLTEINTGVIDTEYMNLRFVKYMRALSDYSEDEKAKALDELHRSFATLNQEEQQYANIFLHDVQRGEVAVDSAKTLRDYITEYMAKAKNDRIHRFAETFGMNEDLLREMMNSYIPGDIIPLDKLEELERTIDRERAVEWIKKKYGESLPQYRIVARMDKLIRTFIEAGGYDGFNEFGMPIIIFNEEQRDDSCFISDVPECQLVRGH